MSLTLALTPNPPEAFTPTSVSHLLELSQSLINTIPGRSNPPPPPVGLTINWSSAKGDLETKLYKATHNREPWVARVSVASDISYNQLLHALLLEKCETERTVIMREDDEQEYVGEERVVGDVKVQDVRKLVHIQAFSPREFLQTVILHELPKSTGKRSFITISIPRVGNIENPSNAKGVYAAIDAVREMGDGKVEIITAISSDAGGSIPRWVQNIAMSSQIMADGQKLLKYLREQQR
ncbi:hypothetical protein FPQ18DRAFT_292905 [Pyronema domesticum]|uniref:DUF3074 domain-containing protein n=1 Tax=Pyronema omphalodes (strain CBS 100304) TaxID=1076935 RepID=U4L867_PYROM|nr:hypothetical protein FPQ18DRAFT_292905 [Pyronema domesticum]CCX13037.1 Similar to hypothetical protein [Tuber melanosporum Mel28]; acc. no. XP_002842456 [Pyronema omphalodes CBS 100304]